MLLWIQNAPPKPSIASKALEEVEGVAAGAVQGVELIAGEAMHGVGYVAAGAEHAVEGMFSSMGAFFGKKKAAPEKDDPKAQLHAALDKAGLGDFKSTLDEHGIDSVADLKSTSDEELTTLGFKVGHLKKFHSAFPVGHEYEVTCPPGMNSTVPGIGYRSSKDATGDVVQYATWGSVVTGMDQGDGWLKVGARYLQMTLNNVPVLTLTTSAATNGTAEAADAGSVSDPDDGTESKASTGGFFSNAIHGMAHMLHLEKDETKAAQDGSSSSAPAPARTMPSLSSSQAQPISSKAPSSAKAQSVQDILPSEIPTLDDTIPAVPEPVIVPESPRLADQRYVLQAKASAPGSYAPLRAPIQAGPATVVPAGRPVQPMVQRLGQPLGSRVALSPTSAPSIPVSMAAPMSQTRITASPLSGAFV